ncbi:uncharacterized protein LOC116414497 [Apis florea]|uniref:uncharacterized protein LOC116414497 n=1 Tax=Apis florea TaxID=7463 RepID=UPI0012FEF00F|nr:uncharacterized protein LOC116414497 [Apis florea]
MSRMIFVDDSGAGFSPRVPTVQAPLVHALRVFAYPEIAVPSLLHETGRWTRMRTWKRWTSRELGRGSGNGACIPQNQFAEMKFYSPASWSGRGTRVTEHTWELVYIGRPTP